MIRAFGCVSACCLLSGCAAIAPLSSLLSTPSTAAAPLQVHEQTSVKLAQDNFILVRTNVVGRSRGFSLLGILTIYPATLSKAMNRLYAAAEMRQGEPQTVAHLVIEQTSSFWILFGIPEVDARADVVEFKPEVRPRPGGPLPPEPPAAEASGCQPLKRTVEGQRPAFTSSGRVVDRRWL